MKILVNEKISQHKFKTPEGYLVCVDSVLARTGKQTYRKNELFLDGDDSEIEIDRTPEEVFSEQTLASFENKPITLEHPHEDVTVDNYKDYAIGFVRDVKQGTFNGQPVILGTLVFTDAEAIREIEDGTRTELSCGYDCDIEDDENPRQTHIRGNHVALCEAGRAGIAKVIDSSTKDKGKSVFTISYWLPTKEDDDPWTATAVVYASNEESAKRAIKKAHPKLGGFLEIRKGRLMNEGELLFADTTPDEEQTTMLEEDLEHFEDVDPRSGESKEDFIARFMEETKDEYPNEKQRLAVAYSYWENKRRDSMVKDAKELSSKSIDNLDELMEHYRRKHPNVEFGEIEKRKDYYVVKVLKDSIRDAKVDKLTLRKKKNEYGEFKVVAYKGGRYDEESTYYTDDWDDAVGTLKDMAKRLGLTVNQQGNGTFVADSKRAEDSLREPPESVVKAFEQKLAKWGIEIVGKGRTMMGRKHYQVETDMNPIKLHNVLKSIDIWLDKEQIPMTWSIGTDENGVTTAGIDLDKQFISDSKSKDASALDFEREVLSCWNAIKRENPDIYEEFLEGYKNADAHTLWTLLYDVVNKTSLHRENPELCRRAKRVWNKYKNFDMNVRNTVSFDSIYTLKIDGQKSRKLVRAKDASEAIEKYKKMFPKERIISVEQSEKFNKIIRNIPR